MNITAIAISNIEKKVNSFIIYWLKVTFICFKRFFNKDLQIRDIKVHLYNFNTNDILILSFGRYKLAKFDKIICFINYRYFIIHVMQVTARS